MPKHQNHFFQYNIAYKDSLFFFSYLSFKQRNFHFVSFFETISAMKTLYFDVIELYIIWIDIAFDYRVRDFVIFIFFIVRLSYKFVWKKSIVFQTVIEIEFSNKFSLFQKIIVTRTFDRKIDKCDQWVENKRKSNNVS